MRFVRTPALPLLVLAAVALISLSCFSTDPASTGPGPNPDSAAEKVALANAAMERILYSEINGPEPSRPGDLDLREPYNLYQEALGLDDNNMGAHFGAAVTGLLILSSDTEVNAAFDEWKAYLESRVPFEVHSSVRKPMGVPLGFTGGRDAFRLPFDLAPLTLAAQVWDPSLSGDPQIDRVQQILESRVLPKLQAAQTHLARVASIPNFQFLVSARMQGDEYGDPAEIDRTDILALRGGCDLLSALCRMAVSYQLGMASYDSLGLVQAFQPGSGWMALRSGGADQMRSAKSDMLSALDDVDQAAASLLAETDSQDNDVIKIGPDGISRADLDSIRANLPRVRDALQNGFTRVEDWDGDASTPPTSLTIHAGNLLTNPLPDFKALLPNYAVRLDRRVWNPDWMWEQGQSTVTVQADSSGDCSAWSWISVRPGETQSEFGGDEALRGALDSVLHAQLAEIEARPGWTGEFNANANAWGTLNEGPNEVNVYWSRSYGIGDRYVLIPVLVWEATRFEDWTWPDPTFHGLFPNMTSSQQFLSTFGFKGENWSREGEIDWTGGHHQ